MEEEEENADDNYVPRSPVPLPDVSTCKPILVWLGANSNTRVKKSKYSHLSKISKFVKQKED